MKKTNNKKLKFLIILTGFFLLTGCNVDYNITIDSNHRVSEKIEFNILNNFIDDNNNNIKEYLDIKTNELKGLSSFVSVKNKVYNDNSVIIFKNRYSSLNDYKVSHFISTIFENISITDNYGIVTFSTNGKYNYEELYGDELGHGALLENLNVKIRFHNVVLESNADIKDDATNTHTWILDSNSKEKNITFKVGNEKRYDIIILDFIYENWLPITGLAVVTLLVVVVALYSYFKYRRNNVI